MKLPEKLEESLYCGPERIFDNHKKINQILDYLKSKEDVLNKEEECETANSVSNEEADSILGKKESGHCMLCGWIAGSPKCCKCKPPQQDWEKEFDKYWGCMFEAGDYESLVKDIRFLLASKEASQKQDIIKMIEEMKKDAGPSPLSEFGLGAIGQDINLRSIGYMSKHDAIKDLNQALSDLKERINK
jgi:hypothetical protein